MSRNVKKTGRESIKKPDWARAARRENFWGYFDENHRKSSKTSQNHYKIGARSAPRKFLRVFYMNPVIFRNFRCGRTPPWVANSLAHPPLGRNERTTLVESIKKPDGGIYKKTGSGWITSLGNL